MAIIWWSSSRVPGHGEPNLVGELLHNAMHLVAFGTLAGAAWCAWQPGTQFGSVLAPVAIAFVYGVVDEWHQSFVPGRVSSAADVLTDVCGGLAVAFALTWWRWRRRPSLGTVALLLVASCGSVVLATLV